MLKPRYFLFVIIWLFSNPAFSQHTHLKCHGEIPRDFITPSSEKYKKKKKKNKVRKKSDRNFYLESIFGVDEILKSGVVIFNDPISVYVDEIVDVLLKDNKKLGNKIKVYTIKAPYVNAFATNQGAIFVSAGLVAHLETEAELAFVLAHEIAHVQEKHVLKFYQKSRKIDRTSKRKMARLRKDANRSIAKNMFSQEQELEADKLGYELFIKSDYNKSAIDGTLDALEFSHVSYQNKPFDPNFFSHDNLKFPDEFFYQGSTEAAMLEQDHEESTHPSVKERRLQAASIMVDAGVKNEDFIIGEDRFFQVRDIARDELVEYQLRDGSIYNAFYNSYLNINKNPESKITQKQFFQSLYYMAKMKNAAELLELKADTISSFGHIASVVHFANNISKQGFNLTALDYMWRQKANIETGSIEANLMDGLLQDYVDWHSSDYDDDSFSEWESTCHKNLMSNPEFETAYNKALAETSHPYTVNSMDRFDAKKKRWSATSNFTKKQKTNSEGYALGRKKTLVMNPTTVILKKKFTKKDQIKSESSTKKFLSIIRTVADAGDFNTQILDVSEFSKKNTEEFNDYAQLNDWISEVIKHDNYKAFIPYNQDIIQKIATKFDAETIVFPIVVSGKSKRSTNFLFRFFWFTSRFIYDIFTPSGETMVLVFVLDVKEQKLILSTTDFMTTINHKDVITQKMYDIFWQIQSDKKK